MAVADFYTGSALLTQALKTLHLRWQNTREQWDDSTAERFGNEHIEPLPQQFRILLDSTGRLSDLLQRAEVDCQ